MASVKDDPTRLSGSTWYFVAVSMGINLVKVGVNLKIGEIDGGNTVLAGEDRRHLIVAQETQFDQGIPQPSPVRLLMLERLLELVRANQVFFEKDFPELARHSLTPVLFGMT